MQREYWLKTNKNINKRIRRFERRKRRGKYQSVMQEKYAKNSLYAAQLKVRATKTEKIVGDFLWRNFINFKFQKGFLKPFHRIVDFYISSERVIIEVDGGYHKEIKEKDDYKDKLWSKFTTIRILNEEVIDGSYISKLNKVLTLTSI